MLRGKLQQSFPGTSEVAYFLVHRRFKPQERGRLALVYIKVGSMWANRPHSYNCRQRKCASFLLALCFRLVSATVARRIQSKAEVLAHALEVVVFCIDA